jgi:predicted enzyme related to lactoylglutathione lyase
MIEINTVFSGFAVKDVAAARTFYSETIGLEVDDGPMVGLLTLRLTGGAHVVVYPKNDHEPANFTILNFEVGDIDAAVRALTERGVELTRYDEFDQDEHGVFRGSQKDQGPDIAWFTDPSGNVLSIIGA